MNDSQNIQRDTPLRRFNTFVWGMALFGVFGLASVIAYWMIGTPQTAYSLVGEERQKVTKEVVEAQNAIIASKKMSPKVISALSAGEKKTEAFVPGTPSYDRANAVPAPVKKEDEKDDSNEAETDNGNESAQLNGEKIFQMKGCAGCHGSQGKTPLDPSYPVLAGVGKDAAYLSQKMQDIKSGKYTTDQTILMKGFILACSDNEINAMSQWLATVK